MSKNDLISLEALLKDLSYCAPELWRDEEYIKAKIVNQKVADAAPVVHGWWDGYNADYSDWLRNDGKPIFIACSVCDNVVLNNGSANWNFCPNCGAKMDGGPDA